ncbi:MAG: mechanosensitive ion channel family protein [Bryobacteraceae bacterium]
MTPTMLLGMLALLTAGQPSTEAAATVRLDGREVMRIRSGAGVLTPAERAAGIEKGLKDAAREGRWRPVRWQMEGASAVILAGTHRITAVTEEEARVEGLSVAELAERRVMEVRESLDDSSQRRSWRALAIATGKLILAWAFFVAVLWLLRRTVSAVQAFIRRWFEELARRRAARGLVLLIFERLAFLALMLAKIGAGVLVIVWFSILLTYSFSLFPATAGISVSLLSTAWTALKQAVLAMVDYTPRGLFVVIVSVMAYYGLQIARIFFRAVEHGDITIAGLHPETAGITYQLVRVAVVLLVLIIVFPYLPGSQSEAFRGVSIFLGVVISLGSGSAVANMMAGVVLAYMRPFRVGDRVRIAETVGDVEARGLLVTRLRTIKNVEVTIPNASILGAQILNYSTLGQQGRLILNTSVTIGYDVPWRQVHELLIRAAVATPGILAEPQPFVLQTSLNDFHVSYEINAYTNRPNEMVSIYSALHANIQDQFAAAGVEILSPSYHALRDGNDTTVPGAGEGEAGPPAFRIRKVE